MIQVMTVEITMTVEIGITVDTGNDNRDRNNGGRGMTVEIEITA